MRLLAVTGSSGGHVFPALGFLDALREKRRDIEVLLVLPKENSAGKIKDPAYKVDYISASSVKFGLSPGGLASMANFIKGALESIRILFKFRPRIVVGFGSAASIPMILFSRLAGIKTLIHEQNVIPGRANRLLAGFADKVAVSFAESARHLKLRGEKIAVTGNPLRKELGRIDKHRALDFFGLERDKFTVLVMGGSQGSRRLNSAFLKALSLIAERSRPQVIHLAGPGGRQILEEDYRRLNISYRLFDFLDEMQYAYSACDLVISRAGATAVAEIISYALPAILIPYPFAYRHQSANAEALRRMGSALIIEDTASSADALARAMETLISDRQRIKEMESRYEGLPRLKAAELLADAALSLI